MLFVVVEVLEQIMFGVSCVLLWLEEKLGVSLLICIMCCMELIEEGEVFLEQVCVILVVMEQVEDMVCMCMCKLVGKLCVDVVVFFMLYCVVLYVGVFCVVYLEIELELIINDCFIDLVEQCVDIVICIGELQDFILYVWLLSLVCLNIVVSFDYLVCFGVLELVEVLEQYQLIGFLQFDSFNYWLLCYIVGDCYQVCLVICVFSGEIICYLVLQGQGIVCLFDFMIVVDLVVGCLVCLLD